MTPYLIISTAGLLLKVWLSIPAVTGRIHTPAKLQSTLMIFIMVFVGYSITQVLVFSPLEWVDAIGLNRLYLMRVHYFLDVLCLISGIYLLLTHLNYQGHHSIYSRVAMFVFIVGGGYLLLFTNAFISSLESDSLDNTMLHLGSGYTGYLINIPRFVMFVCLIGLVFVFRGVYRLSEGNNDQVKSLYAVAACFVYNLNCFIGAFAAYPLIISLRGTLYFLVILLILRKSELPDIRPTAPNTFERRTNAELKNLFREYANDNVPHKQFMHEVEKILLTYKLNKASSFNQAQKSELPLAAQSMGTSLSNVYSLIKKHEIQTPAEPKNKGRAE